jgi:hypothetical protein
MYRVSCIILYNDILILPHCLLIPLTLMLKSVALFYIFCLAKWLHSFSVTLAGRFVVVTDFCLLGLYYLKTCTVHLVLFCTIVQNSREYVKIKWKCILRPCSCSDVRKENPIKLIALSRKWDLFWEDVVYSRQYQIFVAKLSPTSTLHC